MEVVQTRLKYRFETMELDDRAVAVPVGNSAREFRGVIKLNESAAEIFDLLREETTEEEIVASLVQRYGEDEEISGFVHQVITYLKNEGALD